MTQALLDHEVANAEAGTPRASLLFVEAEPLMRYILRDLLQRSLSDLDILEAGSAARALDLLESRRPRILLVDLGLHDTDVIAFTRLVRARYPDTRIVILSAFHGEADVRAARAAGAADYVAKNHVFTELVPAVTRALKP